MPNPDLTHLAELIDTDGLRLLRLLRQEREAKRIYQDAVGLPTVAWHREQDTKWCAWKAAVVATDAEMRRVRNGLA